MTFREQDLTALDAATSLFSAVLDRPLDGDCVACPGWSRRDCVNHVIGGAMRYTAYFHTGHGEQGADREWIEWSRSHDHAGGDPAGAHEQASRALREEFVALTDTEMMVPHRLEPMTAFELLALRVFELVVHSHDLTPDAGRHADFDFLARWTVNNSTSVVERLRAHGVIAPIPTLPDNPTPAESLLALSGRRIPSS